MPRIIGYGMSVPKKVLTNADIESKSIGVDAAWTSKKLGIDSRYVCDTETIIDIAAIASENAIENSRINRSDIDLIIVGTATPHKQAPATACFLQERLDLIGPPAFDMTAVCASFIYALVAANDIMASGKYKNALIVGADTLSKYTDWSDRNCVFFGDGAGAVVLTNKPGIIATHWASNGKGANAWTIEDHKFWRMDGKWVYDLAVNHLCDSIQECLKRANISSSDIDIIIPHQPGIGVLRDAATRLDIPFSKVHTIMDRYSNTSSACIPIALHDALMSNKIKKGDMVLFAGVGAGWTSASAIMEW